MRLSRLLAPLRWLVDAPPPRVPALVLEIEAGYPNGATGATVLRWPLADIQAGEKAVRVPPGADRIVARITDRAGIYAGDTTTVERESEPPPPFLRGAR